MRYVDARYRKDCREEIYRFYLSDGIKVISENTANFAGGSAITSRLWDMLNPVIESRSEEDIIESIRSKLQ